MRVKFQADADLDACIIRGLRRQQEIDIQTAGEAGLPGLTDPEVLRVAADLSLLVTHDRRTMTAHFARLTLGREPSRGVAQPACLDSALKPGAAWPASGIRARFLVEPAGRHFQLLRELTVPLGTAGNLASDAHLAAVAIEQGAQLCSSDAGAAD